MAFRWWSFLVVLCLVASACGNGDDEALLPQSDLVPCADLDGRPTEEVANLFAQGDPCGRDRGLDVLESLVPGLGDLECQDGSFVYWNDAGYGATGGTWTADLDGSVVFESDVFRMCQESQEPSTTTSAPEVAAPSTTTSAPEVLAETFFRRLTEEVDYDIGRWGEFWTASVADQMAAVACREIFNAQRELPWRSYDDLPGALLEFGLAIRAAYAELERENFVLLNDLTGYIYPTFVLVDVYCPEEFDEFVQLAESHILCSEIRFNFSGASGIVDQFDTPREDLLAFIVSHLLATGAASTSEAATSLGDAMTAGVCAETNAYIFAE